MISKAVSVAMLGCAALAFACSGGPNGPSPADGSADRPTTCAGSAMCLQNAVVRCESGVPGELLEQCPADGACSIGRCTSTACAEAERKGGLLGCLFYAFDADNVTADDSKPLGLVVTNQDGAGPAQVRVQSRLPVGGWSDLQTVEVGPHGVELIEMPDRHVEGSGCGRALALRVVSDRPVFLMQVQSDDYDQTSTSSGGTVLLPAHGLADRYVAVGYPQQATARVSAVDGSEGGAAQVAIIGTADNTRVTFRVSNHTQRTAPSADGVIVGAGPSVAFSFTIHDGDVCQVNSAMQGDDLTGSQITADKPIAVFSGNVSTTYGETATGINSPDMAHEQMLPVRAWARRYVAPWLSPQASTCDSILGGIGTGLWRIVAGEEDAEVSYDAAPTVTGLPLRESIPAGEFVEHTVSGGDFIVASTKRIAVVQGIDCEPTLSFAVPADVLASDMVIGLPSHFDHEIGIVRVPGTRLSVDGVDLLDAIFTRVGTGSGAYEVARLTFAPCPPSGAGCVHRIAGQFGMTLRGMDVVTSYATTVLTWLRCADVTGPVTGCIP